MNSVERINGKSKTINIIPKDNSIVIDNSQYGTIMISATGNTNGAVFSINKCMEEVQLIPGNNITITSDTTSNEITIDSIDSGGAVESVNGKIGDVIIGIADIQNLQNEISNARFDGHLNNDLVVSGSTYLQGDELGVDGQSTFHDSVAFNDSITAGHTVSIEGDLYANADAQIQALFVNADSNLYGDLTV
jgi:hypothetical protein